jgi:hypothetical protein
MSASAADRELVEPQLGVRAKRQLRFVIQLELHLSLGAGANEFVAMDTISNLELALLVSEQARDLILHHHGGAGLQRAGCVLEAAKLGIRTSANPNASQNDATRR